MKNVVREEVEASFQMRKKQNDRKLITKLQKFRYLEEKHCKKPNEDGVTFSGLDKVKDVEGDRNTVFHLLQELKDDLETFKAKCKNEGLKKNAKDVIYCLRHKVF